jgi:hypothetical protein
MLQVVNVQEVVHSPFDQIVSPSFSGWKFGVAETDRKAERKEHLPTFNAYGGLLQFYALCTSREAAEAALRLMQL